MGTNYYLHEKPDCPTCQRPFEDKHIGKSSGGWCFSLHVDPEGGINDLPDWVKLWSKDGATIKDEYGRRISPQEMLDIITRRSWERKGDVLTHQWLTENHAVPGPNGLARHAIGPHCLGHGKGTWDRIPGEFS